MNLRCLLPILLLCFTQSLKSPQGVYIHIPFCRRRCFYCNFPVVVIGERPSTQQEQGSIYTSLLLREIQTTIKKTDDTLSELETVYFGGGTPSLLPIECEKFASLTIQILSLGVWKDYSVSSFANTALT